MHVYNVYVYLVLVFINIAVDNDDVQNEKCEHERDTNVRIVQRIATVAWFLPLFGYTRSSSSNIDSQIKFSPSTQHITDDEQFILYTRGALGPPYTVYMHRARKIKKAAA